MKNLRIIFGLGSNLGNREEYLKEAVLQLTNLLELKNPKQSKIFKNPALLLPNSPKEWDLEFYNIAFSADINLEKFPPLKILEIIKKIEKSLGRKESERWAPRQIDIDILAIDDLKINLNDKLTIPHQSLFQREFFLKTFAEIEGEILKKLLVVS